MHYSSLFSFFEDTWPGASIHARECLVFLGCHRLFTELRIMKGLPSIQGQKLQIVFLPTTGPGALAADTRFKSIG
jgi:hypothetical protein